MRKFISKHGSTIFLGIFLLLMIIPKTRLPIQVFIQGLIALPPSTIEEDEQVKLTDYYLTYENEEQQRFNLNENKGKVVLINFWATWCPPCIAEMPSYKDLYADYKQQIDFLFITQDDWATIQKFEQKRQLNLPYYRLINSNTQLDYNKLPTTYIIDKQGKIVLKHVGIADWNSDSFREKLNQIIQK